jgi:hypothetical protein
MTSSNTSAQQKNDKTMITIVRVTMYMASFLPSRLLTGLADLRAWKNWRCCGWAWRARPLAGAPCALADAGSRRDRDRLDELMARAREQADLLEELRAGAAVHLIEAEPGTA